MTEERGGGNCKRILSVCEAVDKIKVESRRISGKGKQHKHGHKGEAK